MSLSVLNKKSPSIVFIPGSVSLLSFSEVTALCFVYRKSTEALDRYFFYHIIVQLIHAQQELHSCTIAQVSPIICAFFSY